VPVITDAILVDMKFGTGAVKVTPAHDFNDFATGKRHGLEEINIFNLDGTVNENGGSFAGLERARARTAVKKALADLGLAKGSKPHRLTVPKSQRSGAVVEPMLSTQWFLKMEGMAEKALAAVRRGHELLAAGESAEAIGAANATVIYPEEWKKTYEHFLENIQDWCVSRQLWWGHQIPAWHGPNGEIRVALERPAECGEDWTQDPDVLDTWFSSALWPFSTQGWTDATAALAKFYPASDLETGYDILFFWVARMMMFGLHFTGKVPFRRILLHGLIVDETGEKMSKVKGNVIDPLDLIYGASFSDMVKKTLPGAPPEEALTKFKKAYPSASTMGEGFPAFGADAVRFTLATYPPSNKRIALAPKRVEGYRHFLNKIWNATRFAEGHLEGYTPASDARPEPTWVWNRWILGELARATAAAHGSKAAEQGFAAFRLDTAAMALYDFFWTSVCDWYLEVTKTVFGKDGANASYRAETQATLAFVLERSLRLLHPFIPYITEEVWQRLPKAPGAPRCLALARYPEVADFAGFDPKDRDVRVLKDAISAARTVRTEYEVHPGATVPFALRAEDAGLRAALAAESAVVASLVKTTGAPVVEATGGARPAATVVSVVSTDRGAVEVLVGLKGLVTAEKEKARIERELKRVDKDLAALDKKLNAKGFADRAPPEVVAEAQQQRASLAETRARLDAAKALADEL
jgi:valyl-tRNA synthetase